MVHRRRHVGGGLRDAIWDDLAGAQREQPRRAPPAAHHAHRHLPGGLRPGQHPLRLRPRRVHVPGAGAERRGDPAQGSAVGGALPLALPVARAGLLRRARERLRQMRQGVGEALQPARPLHQARHPLHRGGDGGDARILRRDRRQVPARRARLLRRGRCRWVHGWINGVFRHGPSSIRAPRSRPYYRYQCAPLRARRVRCGRRRARCSGVCARPRGV
mmetsp:Transcript_20015/g.50648  ORF Transcript_20015/g.50648 Transcript_20015/m.50648 type:complete len:217 (+) Transcript_20015:428-1078(+)